MFAADCSTSDERVLPGTLRAVLLVWQVVGSVMLNYLSYSTSSRITSACISWTCAIGSFAYSIVGSISLHKAIPGLKEGLARDLFAVRVPRLLLPANGPLGWAVPALANALILHSVEHTAALLFTRRRWQK